MSTATAHVAAAFSFTTAPAAARQSSAPSTSAISKPFLLLRPCARSLFINRCRKCAIARKRRDQALGCFEINDMNLLATCTSLHFWILLCHIRHIFDLKSIDTAVFGCSCQRTTLKKKQTHTHAHRTRITINSVVALTSSGVFCKQFVIFQRFVLIYWPACCASTTSATGCASTTSTTCCASTCDSRSCRAASAACAAASMSG